MEDGSEAAIGIAGCQPIPVFAVTHAVKAVPNLTLALAAVMGMAQWRKPLGISSSHL